MEYYILKLYQKSKKDAGIEEGVNRFKDKLRYAVIVCLVMLILSSVVIVAALLSQKNILYYIGFIMFMLSLMVILIIERNQEKKYMDEYVHSYKKKIDILNTLVSSEFGINNKEKVEELINVYQEYIDKRNTENKVRNKIITTLFSIFGGALSISFVNMNIIGLNIISWLYIAVIMLFIIGAVGIIIYSENLFGSSIRRKYEDMIRDLRYLQLIKY